MKKLSPQKQRAELLKLLKYDYDEFVQETFRFPYEARSAENIYTEKEWTDLQKRLANISIRPGPPRDEVERKVMLLEIERKYHEELQKQGVSGAYIAFDTVMNPAWESPFALKNITRLIMPGVSGGIIPPGPFPEAPRIETSH